MRCLHARERGDRAMCWSIMACRQGPAHRKDDVRSYQRARADLYKIWVIEEHSANGPKRWLGCMHPPYSVLCHRAGIVLCLSRRAAQRAHWCPGPENFARWAVSRHLRWPAGCLKHSGAKLLPAREHPHQTDSGGAWGCAAPAGRCLQLLAVQRLPAGRQRCWEKPSPLLLWGDGRAGC